MQDPLDNLSDRLLYALTQGTIYEEEKLDPAAVAAEHNVYNVSASFLRLKEMKDPALVSPLYSNHAIGRSSVCRSNPLDPDQVISTSSARSTSRESVVSKTMIDPAFFLGDPLYNMGTIRSVMVVKVFPNPGASSTVATHSINKVQIGWM